MCYAFTYTVDREAHFDGKEALFVEYFGPPERVAVTSTSLKRSAEDEPEQRPAKALKLSEDANDVETVSKLEGLEQDLSKAEAKIAGLEKEVERLSGRNEQLEDELFDFQAEEETQRGKVKAGKQDDKAYEIAWKKKARETWRTEEKRRFAKLKKEYQTKIDDARKRFDDRVEKLTSKHEDEINSKEETCQKKVDDYKAKNAQLEQETKNAKAEYEQTKKKLKEDTEQIRKKLKEDQQREIKSWKPKHSEKVKEKDAELREKNVEINQGKETRLKLRKRNEKLDEELNKVTAERDQLKVDLEEKDTELQDCIKRIGEQHESLHANTKTTEDLISFYNTKLKREAELRQELHNKIDKYAKERMELQRQVFQMRDALNKATKRVEDLEKVVATLTEKTEGAAATSSSESE